MKQAIIKVIALFLLLVFTAWMAREPGWETITAFIGSLLAYLSVEFKLPSKSKEHDSILFALLLKELPTESNTMQLLAHHDFGGSFPFESINPLDVFIERWQDAEHEFIDKQLNKLRRQLVESIQQFLEKLNLNVYPDESGKRLSIGMRDFEDRPEMFALAKELNELSTNVFQVHQEPVRRARQKLPPAPNK